MPGVAVGADGVGPAAASVGRGARGAISGAAARAFATGAGADTAGAFATGTAAGVFAGAVAGVAFTESVPRLLVEVAAAGLAEAALLAAAGEVDAGEGTDRTAGVEAFARVVGAADAGVGAGIGAVVGAAAGASPSRIANGSRGNRLSAA